MSAWKRIPAAMSDADRRTIAGIFVVNGLEVREVRIKETNRGTPKRFLEYRDTGCAKVKITLVGGKNSAEVVS